MKFSKSLALCLASLCMLIIFFLVPRSVKATHDEVNGCGSGSTLAVTPNGVFANFTSACNNHDRCYGDLGQSKENCDNAFYNGMIDKCELTYPDWWEEVQLQACYGTVEVYFEAVQRAGGDAYREAQSHARQDHGEYDRIHLKNECSRPIYAAIRHQNLAGEWVTRGWYSLDPGEDAYVVDTRNINLYIYAESMDSEDNRFYWSDDERYYSVGSNSETYGFRHKTITSDTWGKWTEPFTCH